MYSRISRRKIIKKKAQKRGKAQINALSPYGNVSFERDKDKSVLFFTECAKSTKIYFPSCFTLALEWSQTSLRQECAESFIHPLPPAGYYPCLRGRKWVMAYTVVTAPSHRGEGWGGVHTPKPLHPSLHGAGRGNPRIVKARSSHGIAREHERAGA